MKKKDDKTEFEKESILASCVSEELVFIVPWSMEVSLSFLSVVLHSTRSLVPERVGHELFVRLYLYPIPPLIITITSMIEV